MKTTETEGKPNSFLSFWFKKQNKKTTVVVVKLTWLYGVEEIILLR